MEPSSTFPIRVSMETEASSPEPIVNSFIYICQGPQKEALPQKMGTQGRAEYESTIPQSMDEGLDLWEATCLVLYPLHQCSFYQIYKEFIRRNIVLAVTNSFLVWFL